MNSIDFVWDVGLDARWEDRLRRLRRYKLLHGNCLVPQSYEEDSDLAKWVANQRTEYKNGNMPSERIEKLEAVGFVWRIVDKAPDPYVLEFERKWDLKYEMLQLFKDEFGHCLVPGDHKPNKSLGRWVAKQRRMFREQRMPVRRKKLLDDIGFVWKVDFYSSEKSTQQKHWDEMYIKLKEYKEKFGDLQVRHDCMAEDGSKLGQWVTLQRSNFRDGTIDENRKTLLDNVGFLWKASPGATSSNTAGSDDSNVLVDTSSEDDESVTAASRPPRKRLRRFVRNH